jgi:hypothetical protein
MKFWNNILADVLDGSGECGSMVHYAFIVAFVGSAFLIFLYLWRKDKLDMDEEPKIKMMHEKDPDDDDGEK